MGNPKDDAKGQFAPSQADRKADGVHSAKPTVITGSEDATVHNEPPPPKQENRKAAGKVTDWGLP
ncbi:hypothetical protein AAIH70_21605 [Neorhizobium sp. BT27B]|uniref:hypothetical protein n=1 Tax=Neorhizobium sp. BT27B TaxID=3142625 RepID=UPI0010436B4A|nr:hypothetical protein EDF70_106170 [Neorhizobium sp. JUb45]